MKSTVFSLFLMLLSAPFLTSAQSAAPAPKEPAHPIDLTDASLAEAVKEPSLIVVDLWAPWCGPCRMMGPIVNELAAEYSGKARFGKLNTDQNPKTPAQNNVRGIPTFLFFKDGALVDRVVGAVPKQVLVDKIEEHLAQKK